MLRLFNCSCVADRYSGSITLISNKRDNELYDNLNDGSHVLLNIGSGSFKHSRWTNVDLPSNNPKYSRIQGRPGRDFIPLDLAKTKTLPFETNSVTAIYTSHCIEHLCEDVVERLTQEFYRTLTPGGVLRVSCPDAELYATLCLSTWEHSQSFTLTRKLLGDIHAVLLEHDEVVLTTLMAKSSTSEELLAHIRDLIRNLSYSNADPSNHISWWTRVSLVQRLHDAGFKDPLLSVAGKSCFPPMTNRALFDNTLPEISIIVEAIKPTNS